MPHRIIEREVRYDQTLKFRDVERDKDGNPIEYTEAQLLQFEIDELEKQVNQKKQEIHLMQSKMGVPKDNDPVPTFLIDPNIAVTQSDLNAAKAIEQLMSKPESDQTNSDDDFWKSLQ